MTQPLKILVAPVLVPLMTATSTRNMLDGLELHRSALLPVALQERDQALQPRLLMTVRLLGELALSLRKREHLALRLLNAPLAILGLLKVVLELDADGMLKLLGDLDSEFVLLEKSLPLDRGVHERLLALSQLLQDGLSVDPTLETDLLSLRSDLAPLADLVAQVG